MKIFIKGKGIIAPGIGDEIANISDEKRECIEPDYTQFFDSRMLRRMSRIVKLGSTAAIMALRDANVESPDAVIVGTGFGCLEDTSLFLRKMVTNKEEMLNPTPFIFSTHNTVASQIAILLKTHGYNSTYSHRNFSFESALSDAYFLLKENEVKNALVGGIDELTEDSFTLLKRLGFYKKNKAGEGSSFFVLGNDKDENCYAELKSVQMLSNYNIDEIKTKASSFLNEEIDALIIGSNKEEISENDKAIIDALHAEDKIIFYKHLSGEYPTSNAYAFSLAIDLFKNKDVKNTLIYNNYSGTHHSFILLSAC
ncbi:MAG: beta-ketoacyl synthase [Bacteroidota bacterium]|nr:beta-ketoacyl synthase [Bacteroidota bacterium]